MVVTNTTATTSTVTSSHTTLGPVNSIGPHPIILESLSLFPKTRSVTPIVQFTLKKAWIYLVFLLLRGNSTILGDIVFSCWDDCTMTLSHSCRFLCIESAMCYITASSSNFMKSQGSLWNILFKKWDEKLFSTEASDEKVYVLTYFKDTILRCYRKDLCFWVQSFKSFLFGNPIFSLSPTHKSTRSVCFKIRRQLPLQRSKTTTNIQNVVSWELYKTASSDEAPVPEFGNV